MALLYYVTHPSVAIDKTTNPAGWDLSERGKEEAKRLLGQDFWPNIQLVCTSSEPKSRSVGAMVAAEFGIPVEEHQELGEADRSKTPFVPLEEYMQAIQEAYAKPDEHVRGWESHHKMSLRNQKAIESLLAAHPDKTIAIIGHGGAGTCVKCYLGKMPLSFSQDPQRTGCIFVADTTTRMIVRDWYSYC